MGIGAYRGCYGIKKCYAACRDWSTKNVMVEKKKGKKNLSLPHHSDVFDGGEKKWYWQYHCRSALKGRRSAPPRWSRDVYSGRRRRGRVPLCHRLLCRLTFQLVVIRSSPCLDASFSASVLRKIPRKRTDMSSCASPSTFPRSWSGVSEGGKTWRGKLPANIYGSCVPSF